MGNIKLIQNFRNADDFADRLTIADGLSELRRTCTDRAGDVGRVVIHKVTSQAGLPFLVFPLVDGDEAWIAFPTSTGCWGTTSAGARIHIDLDLLHEAVVDPDGNAKLKDGTTIRAIEFGTMPPTFELSEQEEAIVYLTVRFLKAERACIRSEHDFIGLDYSKLSDLKISNVKVLLRFINEHIGNLSRDGAIPFGPVKLATIQRVLSLVGIHKVRGRPQKLAR